MTITKQNVPHNLVLLNKILSNQEMIIAKMNQVNDRQTKLELTVNNILCKHNLNTQRIRSVESKIDTMIKPSPGWWYN
tara:strand:+ start:2299 stop:2532 length:234 start_codon:yes stop_codon:yes gene_type:complete